MVLLKDVIVLLSRLHTQCLSFQDYQNFFSPRQFPPLALLKIGQSFIQDDLGKIKRKADIGIFIGYSETSRGFRIYNHRTKKIMETIYVKFDEPTALASKHDSLEPVSHRFFNDDSSAESMNIPSKEDLDNLFGPMYEEYFEKRSCEVSINFTA
ncbi:hypothetical protein Tco_0065403 [Tanacetum coccineum]